MTIAIIFCRATLGIEAPLVTVETHISNGIPSFSIVGLPETAVKESRDRVRSALINTEFEFPAKRITVNLAPADLPKMGSRFDLPIALSILAASGQINQKNLENYEFAGELALSGQLREISGTLPFVIETRRAGRSMFLPIENAEEAILVGDINLYASQHILDICAHLQGRDPIEPYVSQNPIKNATQISNLSEVRGQHRAKRSLEIAAAGGHSLLLFGPPGTGKSMLASRLPGILPTISHDEALEVAALASISSQGFKSGEWRIRPFRSPHHTASSVALVGGGSPPRPGEISLAHHGVLFLDELPEFNRHVLESLREPLESGSITISRAARQAEFPAQFQLIAAMNPCPCGYSGDSQSRCRCTSEQIQKYRARISGPLLDRIDMHIEVPRIPIDILTAPSDEMPESSEVVRVRVEKARERQLNRADQINARLSGKALDKNCQLSDDDREYLTKAIKKLDLSARGYHRILRVSRTIADLAASDEIKKEHLSEALGYRTLDRQSRREHG